ncbi:MAG: septal ring lytic transglycosylase RlpA family protein [Rhodomicrobium sp.]
MYAAVLLAAVGFVGCEQAFAECGIASTYSSGTRTANGERYDHTGISAAHKSLPFGTRVVVRNQRTGHSITVRINDRGPFVAGRIIDLSTGAKNALGMDGLAPVCLEVVSYGSGKRGYQKPNLGERLIQALNPFPKKSGARTRTAKSEPGKTQLAHAQSDITRSAVAGRSGKRSASARHARKHHADSSRGRKRYASTRHRKGYSKKTSRRRQFASRDDD